MLKRKKQRRDDERTTRNEKIEIDDVDVDGSNLGSICRRTHTHIRIRIHWRMDKCNRILFAFEMKFSRLWQTRTNGLRLNDCSYIWLVVGNDTNDDENQKRNLHRMRGTVALEYLKWLWHRFTASDSLQVFKVPKRCNYILLATHVFVMNYESVQIKVNKTQETRKLPSWEMPLAVI